MCWLAMPDSDVRMAERENRPGVEEINWKMGPEVKVRGDVPDLRPEGRICY